MLVPPLSGLRAFLSLAAKRSGRFRPAGAACRPAGLHRQEMPKLVHKQRCLRQERTAGTPRSVGMTEQVPRKGQYRRRCDQVMVTAPVWDGAMFVIGGRVGMVISHLQLALRAD